VGGPTRLPGWLTGIGEWQQDLRSELSTLPETLRLLREGAANMQVVTKRLVDATAALEQLTAASALMADAQRRVDDIATTLRGPLAGTSAADEKVRSAISDLGDAFSAMTQLNPFWPRSGGEPAKGRSRGRAPQPPPEG
jgi:hypothetical protein